ncbi:hypothetical protein HN011_005557 [Eciton burchellii]|nr:hypothetical protein HN011_005557 [Eciton burchellii]
MIKQYKSVLRAKLAKSNLAAVPPTRPQPDIRHTFASVLREYTRVTYDKRKEDEILRWLTEGGNDPLTISRFEDQKRREEHIQNARRMQEKRLSALLSHEEAFLAKQVSLRDIKLQAEMVREEKRQLYEKLDEHRRNRNSEMARIVEECHATKRATRDAVHSMVDQKRRKAAEISEESRQLRLKLVREKEEDARKKADLIREMKAVRTTRIPDSVKDCDPMESNVLGFLCDVSMNELREKVLSAKARQKEEAERRNIVIKQERERKRNLMRSNQRLLEQHRATRQAIQSSRDDYVTLSDFPEIERLQTLLRDRKERRYEQNRRNDQR